MDGNGKFCGMDLISNGLHQAPGPKIFSSDGVNNYNIMWDAKNGAKLYQRLRHHKAKTQNISEEQVADDDLMKMFRYHWLQSRRQTFLGTNGFSGTTSMTFKNLQVVLAGEFDLVLHKSSRSLTFNSS